MAFGPPGNSHNGEIWWLLPNEIGTSAAVVENPPLGVVVTVQRLLADI